MCLLSGTGGPGVAADVDGVVVPVEFAVATGAGNRVGRGVSLGAWAADREAEGWRAVCVGDHVVSEGMRWIHPFVALGEMLASTTVLRLGTAFANNLVRSPVEFAQAALTVQEDSGGRFEAGLGAGWNREELVAMGLSFPTPAERVRRYREALLIVGELFSSGSCRFAGEFYNVDVVIPPTKVPAPVLVGAVAGERTARDVPALVDRVEVLPYPRSSRRGSIDRAEIASVSRDDVRRQVEAVRRAAPDIAVSVYLFVAAGSPQDTAPVAGFFGEGLSTGLIGTPDAVADYLLDLNDLGVERVTVAPMIPHTVHELARSLLSRP